MIVKHIKQTLRVDCTRLNWFYCTPFEFCCIWWFDILFLMLYTVGWGLKTKSWWIDSAIAKFIAFGHTFAMKIIFSPQKRFSSPWVFVWKPENPHYGVKKKSCRKLHIWVSKPIRRKIQNQWKKLELNRAYQLREKSKKPPKNSVFQKSDISGVILDFSLKW